jgi:hypothetical protein
VDVVVLIVCFIFRNDNFLHNRQKLRNLFGHIELYSLEFLVGVVCFP